MLGGNELRFDTIYMAINLGSDPNNMANCILENDSITDAPKRAGRSLAIDDGRLWGVRDHLVWLVETTWADVGQEISRIKTPGDVSPALQIWKQRSQEQIVQLLLRESSSPATAKVLNERRRRLGFLNASVRDALAVREQSRESLEKAQRALSIQLSKDQRAVVEEQIERRAGKSAQAENEYNSAVAKQKELEELLQDGEANFARAEFVHFLRSKRYELTPVNVAQALAGLPVIGWRQSFKRCLGRKAAGANGGAIQIFNTIQRVVQSCIRKSELAKHAESWLKTQNPTKSYAVAELRKDFFYLRWSIKVALEDSARRRDLPYVIAKEYWKRKGAASNLDALFAEEEAL